MKDLLTGDEAIARGAWEAGVRFATAYPGTPSTEILENLAGYPADVRAEWSTNEKVALESAIGASIAGARAISSMKHVGLNVAADPLMSIALEGVTGGLVVITADEPGMHSSQNEQDNRHYARLAHIPLFEPADSQDCLDMVKEAFAVSEDYDTPVLIRMTTRVCHSKSVTTMGERVEVPMRPYVKQPTKYVGVPAHARVMRARAEERTQRLTGYAEASRFNRAEYGPGTVGVVTSGACYHYAREVFGDEVSYLRLGFAYPLPVDLLRQFCSKMETIYVLEENDPLMESAIRELGFQPHGNDTFPAYGELTPDVIRASVGRGELPHAETPGDLVLGRPPMFCAGCPHRGFFVRLGQRQDVLVSGDIGCYGLAVGEPFAAMDCSICMGASISAGHGAQQVFDQAGITDKRVVTVLGDSTFFHTGINSLLNSVYNGSRAVNVILDNRITAMTGQQQNPGTGLTIQGGATKQVDIEALVRACGIDQIRVIDPNRLDQVDDALNWALGLEGPSAIITKWPCALKRLTDEERAQYPEAFRSRYTVDEFECIGCQQCLKAGCPALSYDQEMRVAVIAETCVGCGVCGQLCPVKDAIVPQTTAATGGK